MQGLQNKIALVTGASSGIGRATALAFSGAGAKVVVADVDVERGARARLLPGADGRDAPVALTASEPRLRPPVAAEQVHHR
jgi:NAD(P)-dependent dehydrogenase (short-subunit alcohol dehydrogenase family)